MLKKYIQIFLESSNLQLSNTIAKPSYLDVAKEIEDQQRIKDLEAKKQIKNTLEAIKKSKIQTIFICPNNDAGSKTILNEIKKSKNTTNDWRF